ncbi:MAG TPA: hypothetical protein PL059_12550 [Spirochaetota bacterium]|nr:hypothetical protein [Spirochaetota bacterium]HOM11101.1 hypothetical protein [Spirochaetota bacterium]HPP50871.1 hypothetical protein [Spirochaetota bacterium]
MIKENGKKPLLKKLITISKNPKSSCCSIELEEIPEANNEEKEAEKKVTKN